MQATHTTRDPDGSALIQRYLMSWPAMGEAAEVRIAFLNRFLDGIEPYKALGGYCGEFIRELAEQLCHTIKVLQEPPGGVDVRDQRKRG